MSPIPTALCRRRTNGSFRADRCSCHHIRSQLFEALRDAYTAAAVLSAFFMTLHSSRCNQLAFASAPNVALRLRSLTKYLLVKNSSSAPHPEWSARLGEYFCRLAARKQGFWTVAQRRKLPRSRNCVRIAPYDETSEFLMTPLEQ
jgi:hypothetical protein